MDGLLERLKQKKGFTAAEKSLADWIVAFPDQFVQLSPAETARQAAVSVSVLYRLCRKLDYDGAAQLQKEIALLLADLQPSVERVSADFPFAQDDSMREISKKLLLDYENALHQQSALIHFEELEKAVHCLKNASCIDIYTSAGNLFFAENFSFQLREIGLNVHLEKDEYSQKLCAASSSPKRAALVITYNERGILHAALARILAENETPVVLICSPQCQSSYSNIQARLSLFDGEHHSQKISSYAQRLSILYVLDLLYSSLFSQAYQENLQNKLLFYTRINPDSPDNSRIPVFDLSDDPED